MRILKLPVLVLILILITVGGFPKKAQNLNELFSYQKKLDLFAISSSILTDSEVRYSIVLDNNYKIIKKKPVIAYRYYLNSKNYRTLNWTEKNQAYGIKAQLKNSNDSCVLYLEQYPKMKISIFIKNKKAYPLVKLDDKVVVLTSIKAKAKKGLFGIPDVEYVDITGYDYNTKKVITKRIKSVK